MAEPTLAELAQAAATAASPRFVTSRPPKVGGVDPLGLRQINFDLMDLVLPGINNVGRHIRPYVVTSWAWRRAATCAANAGLRTVPVDSLKDFVDRIEVLFAWSHFLQNSGADLPGRDVLQPLLKRTSYHFGGAEWAERRETREQSTAFTAAITYGPSMKTLGWLQPDPERSGALTAGSSPAIKAALDAFEACIADCLSHPAFSVLGEVEVTSSEARAWYFGWALDKPSEAEKRAMALALAGDGASSRRRGGVLLLTKAAALLPPGASAEEAKLKILRRMMCGRPTDFVPPSDLEQSRTDWRGLQVRQAFRLALEALFFWMSGVLLSGARSTMQLVESFHSQVPERISATTAGDWLADTSLENPTDAIEAVEVALSEPAEPGLASAITNAVAFCLKEAPLEQHVFERTDRLPLTRARREAESLADESPSALLRHIFESWILAQHVYWSVGRGLADARSHGKTLLRLRIVLEEEGWMLPPGIGRSSRPLPTPDRLRTALTLARESGLLDDEVNSGHS